MAAAQHERHRGDAAFIVAARNDAPDFAAFVREVADDMDKLRRPHSATCEMRPLKPREALIATHDRVCNCGAVNAILDAWAERLAEEG